MMKRITLTLLLLVILLLMISFGSSAGVISSYLGPEAGVLTFTLLTGGDSGDSDGSGYANIAFNGETLELCYRLSVANIGTANAAHIHRVSDGSVYIGLSAPTDTSSGCIALTQEQYDELTDSPSSFYVNVHNVEFPDGAVSGVLGFVPVLSTSLTGEQSSDDPDGMGGAAFAFYPTEEEVCYFVIIDNLSTVTAAHIHTGGVNEDGAPLVTLVNPTPSAMTCTTVDTATQNGILLDPAGYYVNVHDDVYPSGAIRGQLGETTILHATTLGLNEVSNDGVLGVGDPDGYGLTATTLNMSTYEICYDMSVFNVSTDFTGAHIHTGAAGTNGGVVVPLTPPDVDGNESGCVDVDTSLLMNILSYNPEYYVNIHNSEYPGGAVRGQLESYQTFSATLSGEAEVNTEGVGGQGDPDGTGYALVHISANDNNLCYTINANDIEAATAAHIHTGVAGVNGGVLVPLNTPDVSGVVTACTTAVDSATLIGIAAAPWAHYVNVHNGEYPGGAVRGQLNVYEVFTAVMTGDQEVPGPGDEDGFGVGYFGINYGNRVLCSNIAVENIETATAAHIHTGAAGVQGGVFIPLPTPDAGGFANECSGSPLQSDLLEILRRPENYYANVHNASFTGGAVRGQLTQFPVFPTPPGEFALLSPANGVIVYDYDDLTTITWEESAGADEYRWILLNISTNTRLGLVLDLENLTPEADDDELACAGGICTLSLPLETVQTLPDGQYSWTVIASTLISETEASNAPFYFTVASDGVELIYNGGFEEIEGNGRPVGWVVRNRSGDKVRCNADGNIVAYEGSCAFNFRGRAGERSKLIQNVDLSGISMNADSVLTFSAYINGSASASRGKAKVLVSYADGVTPRDRVIINFGATSDYEMIGESLNVKGEVSRIRVMFQYRGTSGRVYVDQVSLDLSNVEPAPLGADSAVPLPEAPDDFRRGN